MNFTPNKENVTVLREAIEILIQTINLVGKRAVANQPFTEKAQLKHCTIDILKKIDANLNGFNILLNSFSESESKRLKIPLSLCLRGVVSDCLTGIYLFSFSEDTKSLENELNLISLDYAKYLKDTEELILRYGDKRNDSEIKEALDQLIKKFKKDNPSFFKSTDDSEWNPKNNNKMREGSKFDPRKGTTDRDKFDWLKEQDKDLDYILLYPLFRYFSQYQHYSFASRNLIDEFPNEDFKRFVAGIALITQSCWAFYYALDEISEDIDELNTHIIKKLDHFLE